MSSMDGWNSFCEKLEVKEVDGKFYLKNYPEHLYDTKEEAIKVAERMKDAILF